MIYYIRVIVTLSIIQYSCNYLHAQKDEFYSKPLEIINEEDSVKLAGTLIAPDSMGTYPLALFISGSGPQDRFSTIGKNRPFLFIAKELEKIGIASVCFDDRGTGQSTGSKFTNTMEVELMDHQLILDAIHEQFADDSLSFSHVGLIGHSLGGMTALELNRSNELDFLVLMATPFEKGFEMMLKQKRNIESLYDDTPEEEIEIGINNMRKVYETLIENKDHPNLDSLLTAEFNALDTGSGLSPTLINNLVYQMTNTHLYDILLYDPMKTNYSLDIPTLFIYGSKDLQVPPAGSIQNIDQLIADRISPIDYVLISGVNHLFQKSKDGSPMDYVLLKESINEIPLGIITSWMERTLIK